MKYLFVLLIVFSACYGDSINFADAPEGWNWIPKSDGTFELMTDAQIEAYVEPELYRYDAYRDMQFYLFTRKNPDKYQLVKIDDVNSLKESNFNPKNPTRLIIHGWGGNGEVDGPIALPKKEYFEKGEYNFFGVDWRRGGHTMNYVWARKRSNATGVVMGKFIEFLIRDGKAKMDDMQIAGFSLGGQIVGYAGKYLNGQLPAIYGMDPAGPLFYKSSLDERLDPTDAKYVEVLHTAGYKLGYDKPLGHADFYFNGGRSQPGCTIIDVLGNCAHMRSAYYFAESITSKEGFWGLKCQDRDHIKSSGCSKTDGTLRKAGGDPISASDNGSVYYVKTKKENHLH